MSSPRLVWILLPMCWSRGCFVASRNPVLCRRFDHQIGTFLLFSSACLCLILSLLSWPLISTSPGRRPFCLLLCQPKGLVSCTASPFVFVICGVGDPASFTFCLTSLPKPRILRFLTLVLMSSWSRPWMILCTVTGKNSCSAPSELLRSIFFGRSSIVLILLHFFLVAVGHLVCLFVRLRRGLSCSAG